MEGLIAILVAVFALWWVKRKLHNAPPESNDRLIVTSSGLALVVLMVFALLIGTSQVYLAPETEFGRFVSTGFGLLFYWAAVTATTIVLGLVLDMLGFTLFRRPDGDE